MNTIDDYLDALKTEMKGADPALVQDALADAREHLTLALEAKRAQPSGVDEAEVLQTIIDEYGTAEETASAYKEIERRTSPVLHKAAEPGSFLGQIFGVYIDPHTWGSLLFMFIAFITGILYFTWVVTGLSLSLGLIILIIGVPFAILFLLSVRGLALLEGRIVEAVLGERMPHRPLFAQPGMNLFDRMKSLITDKHTWLSMLYLLLQMPLGIVYFTLTVCFLSISIAFIGAPVGKLILNTPNGFLQFGSYVLPTWYYYWLPLAGLFLLTLSMHGIRAAGWLHGRYAKWMLVS